MILPVLCDQYLQGICYSCTLHMYLVEGLCVLNEHVFIICGKKLMHKHASTVNTLKISPKTVQR